MQVKGKIFQIYQDAGKWGMLVGDPDPATGKRKKVSGFGTCPKEFAEGKDIDIEVIENKGFLNYKAVKETEGDADHGTAEIADVTRSIARAVAWKCAVQLYNQRALATWDDLLNTVRKIEVDLLFEEEDAE